MANAYAYDIQRSAKAGVRNLSITVTVSLKASISE